jgi:hypothetical protein
VVLLVAAYILVDMASAVDVISRLLVEPETQILRDKILHPRKLASGWINRVFWTK